MNVSTGYKPIAEADWKRLRKLKEVALERLCSRILNESQAIITRDEPSHDRYLALWRHIDGRDRDVADAFNRLSRSTALDRLATMRALGLVTDAEMEGFSQETREKVELRVGSRRRRANQTGRDRER